MHLKFCSNKISAKNGLITMLREPSPQQYLFETMALGDLVPEGHLVRKIDAIIDFEFIRNTVAHLYCR
ncbi:hypothetical protein CXM81_03365 [Citrobacter freundii]|nr:hypothetical protein CXM87_03365 [Citrobacter freundii]QNM29293.1 hypothetical protein CXM80_03365 [Citrobacter freundii]QNM34527.1 hypothetical protein CXM81_03365 [Citrobacter freundii]